MLNGTYIYPILSPYYIFIITIIYYYYNLYLYLLYIFTGSD